MVVNILLDTTRFWNIVFTSTCSLRVYIMPMLLNLSFLIIIIFIFTSVWIGRKTYDLGINSVIDDKEQMSDGLLLNLVLALGMVGTVTGFLYMLGTAFENIDITDALHYKTPSASMAKGMSTASIYNFDRVNCSLIIKVQLVNYEVANWWISQC